MFQIKKNIRNILDEKKNFLSEYFIFLLLILFFFKSFDYIFYWFNAFKEAINGNADHIFWDFEVYICAAQYFIEDKNPYDLTTECSPSNKPFIYNYPPLTIFFFLPFTLLNFFYAKIIWAGLLIFSFFYFLKQQKKLYQIRINYFLYFYIVLFALDKAVIYSFFTGNMSFVLQILLACSFYFLYINKKK
jgi:hypothetical protein